MILQAEGDERTRRVLIILKEKNSLSSVLMSSALSGKAVRICPAAIFNECSVELTGA